MLMPGLLRLDTLVCSWIDVSIHALAIWPHVFGYFDTFLGGNRILATSSLISTVDVGGNAESLNAGISERDVLLS